MADRVDGDQNTPAMDDPPGNADSGSKQAEIREWMNVNRMLRRNGLSTVKVFSPSAVQLESGRYVTLDMESSQGLRMSVLSLLTEVDRKDSMMQELGQTNSQLREEVASLTRDVDAANAKAKDIKVMLECSRSRVQELEGEHGRSTSQFMEEGERLRNTKSAMNARYRQLETKLEEQDRELARLRRENFSLMQEEERKSKRQNQAFVELRSRTARPHSVTDQKMLDVIDSYEGQIYALQKQLDEVSIHSGPRSRVESSLYQPPSHPGRGILRSYEKQLRERDRKIQELEEERHLEKQSLGARPEFRDYRLISQRVKKLERLLAHHNISIPGEKSTYDPFVSRKKFSTRLEDLDFLPANECQRYLRAVCEELETDSIDCLPAIIQELKEEISGLERYQEYCRELSDIVEGMDEISQPSRYSRRENNVAAHLTDANMTYYLQVVANWQKDMASLGSLQEALNQLLEHTVAWTRAHVTCHHSVPDMVELLERVVHADKADTRQTLMEDVSRSTLEGIVGHFQTLFDVPKVSGVFPRMNQIYRALGEAKNVQTTLKNLLGLVEDAPSSVLVDAVGHLCHSYNSSTAEQLKKLLQTDDLNGVIRRLDEHTKFFPAFKGVIYKLFDILGVDKMDEIIPAVRAVKLLAQ